MAGIIGISLQIRINENNCVEFLVPDALCMKIRDITPWAKETLPNGGVRVHALRITRIG